jgi:hypothetical protein
VQVHNRHSLDKPVRRGKTTTAGHGRRRGFRTFKGWFQAAKGPKRGPTRTVRSTVQHRYFNDFEEIQMNREFKPSSAMIRAIFATASLLASTLIVSSIASLADYYHTESRLAIGQRTAVAQR